MISQPCSKGNVWTDKLEYNVVTIIVEKWAQLSGNMMTEWLILSEGVSATLFEPDLKEFTEL